jgi:branched-chain amino acid transport system ATP-binding protein
MGKSTILKTIAGFLPVESGIIRFDSVDLTNRPIYERGRLGIAYVPDDKGLFVNLTVSENLQVARMRTKNGKHLEQVFEVFPEFSSRLDQLAGTLSGGEQEMLSVARALITGPQLLVLDEISQGLAPQVLERIGSALAEIKQEGAILLTEQNLKFGCSIAERVYVIDSGQVVFEGTVRELHESQAIELHMTV